jgi:phosphotransferase system HPr-like phosphotransfer protein
MAEKITREMTLVNKYGMHVRPAGLFVKMASRYDADVEVEKALQQKALGYTVAVKKVYKCREIQYSPEGKKISEADVVREGVDEVYVPADMRAQSFWLKNRRPERWRDKADHTAEESARVEIVDDLDGGEDG